jgi:hypothetical protein
MVLAQVEVSELGVTTMEREMKRSSVSGKRDSRSLQIKTHNEPPSQPQNLFQLALQILNSVGRFRQILIVTLVICGACFAAWSQIPEQGKLLLVNRLLSRDQKPVAGFYPSVDIEESKMRFDLTEWTPVPKGGDPSQFCKVTTDEHITLRRVQKQGVHLARRAATTGAPPQFRSQTHPVSTQLSADIRAGGPRMTDYDVLLDIGQEPLGRTFQAHLRSVRMGSFRDPNTEWAASTILQPTARVIVEVVFPKAKVGKNFRFSSADMGDGSNYVQVEQPQFEVTENSIKWTIERPKLGLTYRMDWDW